VVAAQFSAPWQRQSPVNTPGLFFVFDKKEARAGPR
jgi:hypothetical protein